MRVRALPPKNSSVQEDWRAWLPVHKAEVFAAYVRQFDTAYAMFSVSLNEALELRRTGKAAKSCRAVWVIPGLCTRLADSVAALLRSLDEHARHYGTIPNALPLDPANFQSIQGQRTARMSDLLSRVLLTHRSQFLHKIGTLQEMVGSFGKDFREAAEDLGCGVSNEPSADWQAVDSAHFDLNTCLRESIVLLKSFLLVLPDDQLGAFQKTVRIHMHASQPHVDVQRSKRDGRNAPIARE